MRPQHVPVIPDHTGLFAIARFLRDLHSIRSVRYEACLAVAHRLLADAASRSAKIFLTSGAAMTLFCKSSLAVLLGLLCCCPVAGEEKPDKKASLEQAAKALVDLLDKGEFEKATGNFDDAMLRALPSPKLKDSREKVIGDAGTYKKQVGSRFEKADKYDVVYVTCEFAKKKLDVRVVFDGDGKVAGLFFTPARPTGDEEIWEGKLKVGGAELRLVFHLFKQKDGTYLGTMDSPDQGAKGIALDEASVKDDAVRLELKSAGIVYEGKRDKAGLQITGDFKQAGQTFPLTLSKAAKTKESRQPKASKTP
jgi:hypothetical protein